MRNYFIVAYSLDEDGSGRMVVPGEPFTRERADQLAGSYNARLALHQRLAGGAQLRVRSARDNPNVPAVQSALNVEPPNLEPPDE